MAARIPHPLSALSLNETNQARDIVLSLHPGTIVNFRTVYLTEPPKAEVIPFLALEHAGKVTEFTPRPARLAEARYDVVTTGSKYPEYHESVVDLRTLQRVKHQVVGSEHHASLTV